MRSITLTLLTALLALLVAGQSAESFPACAVGCMDEAVGNTTCGATDYYCQCTTGNVEIQAVAIGCLCKSSCTTSDLIEVVQVSNEICSSALSVSSQTYTPATVGLSVCATVGAVSGASSAASVSATATGSSTGKSTATGTSSTTGSTTGSQSASSASAAASTAASSVSGAAGHLGYSGAGIGLGALAVLVL